MLMMILLQVWLDGSSNHRSSNLLDHASSHQHKAATSLLKRDLARSNRASITTFSPIARCLLNMDASTKERMMKKFDLCYVMAKEGLSFNKYPPLYELECRHGVDLGQAYKTDTSAKSFTHYIAESQRQKLLSFMRSELHFFSFLIDGTTDAGNVEDEMIVLQFCCKDDGAKEVRSCARYFSIFNPDKGDTDGLVDGVKKPLEKLVDITDCLDKSLVLGTTPTLVGCGTDGASVNVGQHKSVKAKF